MSSFHIRPRFRHVVRLTAEEVQDRIIEHVEATDGRFEIKRFPDFLCLRICLEDRHFFSPRLNLSLDEDESGGTAVAGIYGPNANAWSFFLFSYLIVGFLGLLAGMMVVAQWIIGSPLTWVWGVAAAGGGILILYLSAQFGQKLAAQQTFLIHQAYENAVGESVEVR